MTFFFYNSLFVFKILSVFSFCLSAVIMMLSPFTLQQIISTLFVLGSTAVMAEGECPAECSCTPSPPLCPPGVSWVTDHCGCCKVCARQFNEDCSATEPCDLIKGLRCHLGAGGDPKRGLCRAEAQGLPCEFSGQVYQHGEDFQPNCQHQCTCMDGVVGCMPLCRQQVPLPNWHCLRPRLARPEGGCCEEWVCDDDNHISEEPDKVTHTSLPDSQPLPNHISVLLQAQPQPQHPAATGGAMFREMVSFPMFNANFNRLTNQGVKATAFKELSRLAYLYLGNNQLTAVPQLPESLQVVHLHNNKILTITDKTFCKGNTSHYIRTNMHEVRLDGNPLVLSKHPDSFICLQSLPIGRYN